MWVERIRMKGEGVQGGRFGLQACIAGVWRTTLCTGGPKASAMGVSCQCLWLSHMQHASLKQLSKPGESVSYTAVPSVHAYLHLCSCCCQLTLQFSSIGICGSLLGRTGLHLCGRQAGVGGWGGVGGGWGTVRAAHDELVQKVSNCLCDA
jgi:hypothetical protein